MCWTERALLTCCVPSHAVWISFIPPCYFEYRNCQKPGGAAAYSQHMLTHQNSQWNAVVSWPLYAACTTVKECHNATAMQIIDYSRSVGSGLTLTGLVLVRSVLSLKKKHTEKTKPKKMCPCTGYSVSVIDVVSVHPHTFITAQVSVIMFMVHGIFCMLWKVLSNEECPEYCTWIHKDDFKSSHHACRDNTFKSIKGEMFPGSPGIWLLHPTRWTVKADVLTIQCTKELSGSEGDVGWGSRSDQGLWNHSQDHAVRLLHMQMHNFSFV